jgi:hypothetical protein
MPTGISVRVDGVEVKGVVGYSVAEESTPVDVADTTGAAGKITVPIFDGSLEAVAAKRMYRKDLRLADPEAGVTTGIVRLPSGSGGSVSVSADERLVLMSARRLAGPYNGTVAGYAEYLLSLIGITSGFDIDASFEAVDAVFPGWQEDVWLMAKALGACYGGEWALVGDTIVFRPMRQSIASNSRDADLSWSVDDANLARSVEGYWYDTSYQTNYLAFPPGGWNEDTPVIQVEARQTVVVNYPLNASLVSVQQPVAADFVGRCDNTISQYCVQGNDGKPIKAAQWKEAGGQVIVEIGEDTRSIDVTVIGPGLDQYSPFQLAATAGPSDYYSSLRIIGTGVFFDKFLVTRPTSAPADIATVEIGATVDCPFITSPGQLNDLLTWTASRYSSPRHTLSVRTKGINRTGDVFGNVAGARVLQDGLWYRIRSTTIGPDITSYNAEGDTTADDLNDYATSQGWVTIDDFNAAWEGHGYTFDDFNLAPLTNPNGV